MSESSFSFKQFIVKQQYSALKVGTDGVLLGSWVNPIKAQKILDIGTGTGLLALMIAQKTDSDITAIEINSEACIDAFENFHSSKWNNQLRLLNVDFNNYIVDNNDVFDLIISNPPYFKNSLHCNNNNKTIARHSSELTHENLLTGVNKILSDSGSFYVIVPSDLFKEFVSMARIRHLHPQEILKVFSKENDDMPKRTLIRFARNDCKYHEDSLYIFHRNTNTYTDTYKQLTCDYYLDF